MKLELSDGMSNNSDFSNDSQCSQVSVTETEYIATAMGCGVLLTPTNFITSLEGLNSGVPTRTTPTVTPTTLKNIEQTFIELQSTINETHENEAGFVPPLVHSIGNNQYISASDADIYSNKSQQSLWPSSLSQSSSDSNTRSTPPLMPTTNLLNTPQTTRRNMGGRKPTRDLSLSPEEEERRQIRRERNKQAAARCRKRRVDHTNALIKETEELEAKKQKLVEELHKLKNDEEQIKCFLEMHENSPDCRLHSQSHPSIKFPSIVFDDNKMCKRVKTEIIEQIDDVDNFVLPSATAKMLSSTVAVSKPNRPNFLAVGATMPFKTNMTEIAGIPISTPSTGMTFNFDSLMGGGTGLTPVSTPLAPSCSTQQRNIPVSMADVMSPDTCSTRKLVSL